MAIVRLIILLIFFTACSAQHLNLSLDSASTVSMDQAQQAYCNRFNLNGFNGIIVSSFNTVEDKFNPNKARLFLWEIPHQFTYPRSNYIQFHPFYVKNNKEEYNSSPVSVELFNNQSFKVEEVVTAIGHNLLEDLDQSIDTFLQTYSFVLQDIEGWQAVSMSVFDSRNKPLATTKVLIPPFSAHPDLFFNQINQERLLFQLHPFSKISAVNNNEMAFYDKAIDICSSAPVDLNIPKLDNHQPNRNSNRNRYNASVNPLESLLEDLSVFE